MTTRVFDKWLKNYGRAWEEKDVKKFASLFTEEAKFHRTPFDEPKLGPSQIGDAFRNAVARQDNIHFGYSWILTSATTGIAHWWCSYTRVPDDYTVHLDGCLVIDLTPNGRCKEFWEWWHTDEIRS